MLWTGVFAFWTIFGGLLCGFGDVSNPRVRYLRIQAYLQLPRYQSHFLNLLYLFLIGHHDLVYDIAWSPNDDAILTASSDGTAKIWPFRSGTTNNTTGSGNVVTLQHTCFVYAAQFFPNQDRKIRIVATGAYPQ